MTTTVFISHGHDELSKAKLKDFVRNSLHMEAVVLAEQPDLGLTIVEKLEHYGRTCQFALILLTGDDETASGGWRARQNVIHELGYFHGELGRKRVLLLKAADVELFSNITGLIYKEFPPGNIESVFDEIRLAIEADDDSQQSGSVSIQPTQLTLDTISNRIQATWDRYIQTLYILMALNVVVILGVAAVAAFLPKFNMGSGTPIILRSKGYLFCGLVLLMFCLICQVAVRIWVQSFMEYEVMPPPDEMHKYYGGRIHYTVSYRLNESSYRWQHITVRIMTVLAPLSFLAGMSLSLVFFYRNLQ